MKRVLFLVIFALFASVIFANEQKIDRIDFSCHFESAFENELVNFASSSIDKNQRVVENMGKLRNAGLGLFISGIVVNVIGIPLMVVSYFFVMDTLLAVGLYVLGYFAVVLGQLMFYAGLAMFIVGATVGKHYQKKMAGELSMTSYADSEQRQLVTAFVIPLRG